MIKIASVETIRAIEKAADASGLTYSMMMEQAGKAVAIRALELIAELPSDNPPKITVLVGPGNNGGDGLVAARFISQESAAQVRCYLLKRRTADDPNFTAAQAARVFIANAEDDQRYRVLLNMVASAHIIIDALFGIGVRLPLAGETEKIMRVIHQALTESEQPSYPLISPGMPSSKFLPVKPYIIAVDCPTGLDADSGVLDKNALHADETITFIAAKPGLFLFPGAEAVGQLSIASAGIPADIDELKIENKIIADAGMVGDLLPKRSPSSHKGTFGKALIVGGSVNYTGAPSLSAESAYRIGAGLVTVAAPPQVLATVAAHLLEATWMVLPHDMGVISEAAAPIIRKEVEKYDSMLIGPGMGRDNTTRDMLARLFATANGTKQRSMGFMANTGDNSSSNSESVSLPPTVIDADGLFLLSQINAWWKSMPEQTVITPHPGEMGQLTGLTIQEVQASRWTLATEKAEEWGVTVVLKGAHTVIAGPDGQFAILPFKTAALATAGTGDILAGMIAGLLAQGLKPFEAALAAGYIHGLAGQQLEHQFGTRSAIASDLLRHGLTHALRALGIH